MGPEALWWRGQKGILNGLQKPAREVAGGKGCHRDQHHLAAHDCEPRHARTAPLESASPRVRAQITASNLFAKTAPTRGSCQDLGRRFVSAPAAIPQMTQPLAAGVARPLAEAMIRAHRHPPADFSIAKSGGRSRPIQWSAAQSQFAK
jgi:hypothetical protein